MSHGRQTVLSHRASRIIVGRNISLEVGRLTVPGATVTKEKVMGIDPDRIFTVKFSATIGVVWFRITAESIRLPHA